MSKKNLNITLLTISISLIVGMVIYIFMTKKQISSLQKEQILLNADVSVVNDFLKRNPASATQYRFSTKKDMPNILNYITQMGSRHNVEFLSIDPQKINNDPNLNIQRWPIKIVLVSRYNDYGQFLKALSHFDDFLINVSSFTISDKGNALSQIKVNMVVETYLGGA